MPKAVTGAAGYRCATGVRGCPSATIRVFFTAGATEVGACCSRCFVSLGRPLHPRSFTLSSKATCFIIRTSRTSSLSYEPLQIGLPGSRSALLFCIACFLGPRTPCSQWPIIFLTVSGNGGAEGAAPAPAKLLTVTGLPEERRSKRSEQGTINREGKAMCKASAM